ncbi:MAG: electron transport complex subunit RsxA [Deltaproteobacteria bacterium]|nr:electron transport complex subunit RsxA [Deltaproteobacteria bacterium]MBN2670905.1 electron transport complex subunit RsxA [Deltaproteobacteria bacterium]
MDILVIVLLAMLTENFVLSKFLGICPFLGVSKKIGTAAGMAMAVLFVMLVASLLTFALHTYVLVPLEVTYLQTIVFILVIASTVQLTEMAIQKLSPSLYEALGIFLPLITTNCAVLGLAVLNIDKGYNLIQVLFNSIGAAGGFAIALLLFAGLREKMDTADIPDVFKGAAIAFVTAGILSLAFMGFSGLAPAN